MGQGIGRGRSRRPGKVSHSLRAQTRTEPSQNCEAPAWLAAVNILRRAFVRSIAARARLAILIAERALIRWLDAIRSPRRNYPSPATTPSQAGALLHALEAIVLSRQYLSPGDFGRAKPSVTQIRCMVAAATPRWEGPWRDGPHSSMCAAERPHQSNLAVPPGHLAAAEIQIDLCPGQNCPW